MPKFRDLVSAGEEYRKLLELKGAQPSIVQKFEEGLDTYLFWKKHKIKTDELLATLNKKSKEYNSAPDKEAFKAELKDLKDSIKSHEEELSVLEKKLGEYEIVMPNWITPDVPIGYDDSGELPLKYNGKPKVWKDSVDEFKELYKDAEFEVTEDKPFHHSDIVGRYVDEENAGNVAMARFYYEMDEIALLDMAISMYAIEFFKNAGFGKIMIPPYIMRRSVEERITYFEAFQDTIFEIEKDELLLIPSSEHSIVAYYSDKIFDKKELPIRILAWSPCFRREAGSHGKDTRGLFRVRQFHKVELHSIVMGDEDIPEIDRMVSEIESFLTSLHLPSRSVIVPSGEMDKRATKQIDVQTWFPGQNKFRETHSVASVGDWVSEKLLLRYKEEKKMQLVKNVYGTAVAVQRMICAIVENCYDPAEQVVRVPEVLHKYMMGVTVIPLNVKLK